MNSPPSLYLCTVYRSQLLSRSVQSSSAITRMFARCCQAADACGTGYLPPTVAAAVVTAPGSNGSDSGGDSSPDATGGSARCGHRSGCTLLPELLADPKRMQVRGTAFCFYCVSTL
jgi:hypothetical protein